MKGSFPSALKSHCAAFCQLSPSCFVSFSVISFPGLETTQMFIHRPTVCVEVSRVSQIIALMFLCGSVSCSAETHGCSQSSQGHVCYQIKATWKCHYADGIMISLNWRGAPYKMIIIWLTETFYYQSKVSLEHFFMPSTLLSIVQKSLGHCVKHQ